MSVVAFLFNLEPVRRAVSSATCAAIAIFLTLGLAEQAQAVTVTIEDQQYEVSTVVGTFDDLEATLTAQVWWGDDNLAGDFFEAVGDSLGFPNDPLISNPLGPLFAFKAGSTQFQFRSITDGGAAGGFADRDEVFTFAIAEIAAVPLPASLPLLFAGAGALVVLRRRRNIES